MSLPVSHGLYELITIMAGYFWASGKYARQVEELIKQWSLPHFSFGREDRGGEGEVGRSGAPRRLIRAERPSLQSNEERKREYCDGTKTLADSRNLPAANKLTRD